jgi:serine/threonine protein kinase
MVLCPSLGNAASQAVMDSAKAAAKLRHHAIAEIIDAQQDGQIRFLALESAPGNSIRDLLKTSPASRPGLQVPFGFSTNTDDFAPLAPLDALAIISQVIQAIENGHRQNLVHGGLKPENIILMEDSTIKLTEFGISRLETHKPLSDLPLYMGSLGYLAPEQFQGQGNSPASDLYALGAILYEMLTGQPPYTYVDRDEEFIAIQLRQPPIPPRRRNLNLSRSLEHLVLNLLNKAPEARMTDAKALRQALNSMVPELEPKPLLGREAAQQKLRQHLKRAASGQSGMLIIDGHRGIGKTRLALSAADQVIGEQQLTTLHSELYAFEDSRPYRVFAQVLQHHLLSLPAHQLSQLLDDLGELAQPLTALIPKLQSTTLGSPPAEVDCQKLQDAICQTLELMTKAGPVMLILDSLQWIDLASLRLLKQLARQRIPRLLIVAVYRSEDVNEDHPLHSALTALDSWIDDRLHLTPLGPIEVHQMASSLGTTIPPDFGLWLYSETEGNPLHTTQLIQAFSEGPSETRQPRERPSSMTIEDVILRRLERLPNVVLTILRQAAVLGHEFGFDHLRVALDQPEVQVLKHLDIALRAGLILGHPTEDRYCFSHPTVREVIYSEMLGGVRQRYHARVARILEQEGISGRVDEKIDSLAYHCVQAGEHTKAVTYLARAARRSRILCADDAALVYVNQALELVKQLVRTASNEREREQRLKQRHDLLSARERLETSLEKA